MSIDKQQYFRKVRAIMRTVIILFAISLALPTVTLASEGIVNGSVVNLRSGPGLEHARISQVLKGDRLDILQENCGWYQVKRGEKTAWIAGWLVELVNAEIVPSVNQGADQSLNNGQPDPINSDDTTTEVNPNPNSSAPNETSLNPPDTWLNIPGLTESGSEGVPQDQNQSNQIPEAGTVQLRLENSEAGIKLFMDSVEELEAEVKEYSAQDKSQVVYRFKDKKIAGDSRLSVKLGGGKGELLQVSAVELTDSLQVLIEFPKGLIYETASDSNDGQYQFYLPNQLTEITEVVSGNGMQTILLRATSPIKYQSDSPDGKVQIDLLGIHQGDRLTIPYLKGAVASRVSVKEQTERKPAEKKQTEKEPAGESPVTKLEFKIQDMKRFSTAELCDNTVVSLVLIPVKMTGDAGTDQETVVVIDPGHGGSDPGAIASSSKCQEKDHNLAIALLVKEQLEQEGLKVISTRTDDRYLSLEERSQIANRAEASVFVAIHCDSFTSPTVSGTTTFYYAPRTSCN
ncbi:MAG: N-acetylmuramoyl-L-alanine amidase [Bacillota bacterium]